MFQVVSYHEINKDNKDQIDYGMFKTIVEIYL